MSLLESLGDFPSMTLQVPGLNLYAFSNLSNKGAVDDDMLVRWCCDEAEDEKGNVEVECRKCLRHC